MPFRDRVRFLNHREKEILLLDFSNTDADEVIKIIDHAKDLISTRPAQSLLTLTDVTNARFNERVGQGMKEFALYNKPYVKAGAVVGITGLKRIIFGAVMAFTQRELEPFDSREEALHWLTDRY